MIVDDLKNSILTYAFSGKLSNTIDSDTLVDVMMDSIKHIHEELISKKIIKDDKKVEKVSEENYPYNIPSTWRWDILYNVIDVRDGTHDSPRYYSDGIPLITSKNLNSDGTLDKNNVKFISEKDAKIINNRSNVDVGDILFAMIGSIGNPVIIKDNVDFCIKNVALFKNPVKDIIDNQYLYYYLYYAQTRMKKESTGGVQQFVSLNYLRGFYIPIPPFEEQLRIVSKIKILFNKIEDLSIINKDLDNIKEKFKKDFRKSVLYHYTNLNNKNIKKIYEVTTWDTKFKGVDKTKQPQTISFNHITAKELKEMACENGNVKLLSTGLFDGYTTVERAGNKISTGEVITIPTGGNANIKYYHGDFVDSGNNIAISSDTTKYNLKFIYYYLLGRNDEVDSYFRGVSIKHPDMSKVLEMEIDIPSFEEQQRIVDKIEQLLPLCDDIERLIGE